MINNARGKIISDPTVKVMSSERKNQRNSKVVYMEVVKTISRFIIKIDAAKKGIVAGGKILDPELYAWTLT